MQNTMIPRLRYFTISLVAGLAMAAVGSAITINTFKPKHEAKLFFRVIDNREWLICFGRAGETDDQTVASWINSEVVRNLVAIDPRVAGLDEIRNAGNPAAKLMAMADVTREGGNDLFAITVRSEVPAHAALIAETYWEKFEESQKLAREQRSKLLMETLDSEIAATKKQVKLLEMDLQEARKRMDESASAEENEYATVKLDYELKNKNYETERARLLSYIQRRREIPIQQTGPFSITREYMTDENEGLPVFEQPVEKYPWKPLAMINGLSFAAAFLVVGLLIFNLRRTETLEPTVDVSP